MAEISRRLRAGKKAKVSAYGELALKLYPSQASKAAIFREAANLALLEQFALPTPRLHAAGDYDGRWGTADGSGARPELRRPDDGRRPPACLEEMARLHRDLHQLRYLAIAPSHTYSLVGNICSLLKPSSYFSTAALRIGLTFRKATDRISSQRDVEAFMSVRDIPLRKLLQLFYAPEKLRRSILKEDIRLDRRKEQGGSRSQGGDFYAPFWADVKAHISGNGDIRELTAARIQKNKHYSRLYPLLTEGVLGLLSARLRWTNEQIEIVPKSVHGMVIPKDLQAVIRVRDAIHAQVRVDFNRVVYPYFSEAPLFQKKVAGWEYG